MKVLKDLKNKYEQIGSSKFNKEFVDITKINLRWKVVNSLI